MVTTQEQVTIIVRRLRAEGCRNVWDWACQEIEQAGIFPDLDPNRTNYDQRVMDAVMTAMGLIDREEEEKKNGLHIHMFVKAMVTWFNEDRGMLMSCGIWTGHDNWEEQASALTYEHCFDVALAHSCIAGQVQLRDDAGKVLVEFNRGQVMTKHIGW